MSDERIEIAVQEEGPPRVMIAGIIGSFLLAILALRGSFGTLLLCSPVPMVLAGLETWREKRRARVAIASEAGIVLRGDLVPRRQLRDVWVQKDNDGTRLIVARDDGRVFVLSTRDVAAAERAAELFAARRALVAGVLWRAQDWVTWLGFVLALVAFAFSTNIPTMLVSFIFPVIAIGAAFRRTQVVAGTDGLEIRTAFAKSFHPYSTIAAVLMDGVVLSDGRTIPLSVDRILTNAYAKAPWSQAVFERFIEGLRARVAQAKERAHDVTAEAAVATNVEGGGYRDAAVPDSALWKVVESDDVAPEMRARAAETLARRSADARTRIADAATTIANPELHGALVRIAETTDEEEGDVDSKEKRRSG